LLLICRLFVKGCGGGHSIALHEPLRLVCMHLRAEFVGGWFAAGRMMGASVARRWDGWDYGLWIETLRGFWGPVLVVRVIENLMLFSGLTSNCTRAWLNSGLSQGDYVS
jgi:hypothetical protein